jgi:hypothetical protein
VLEGLIARRQVNEGELNVEGARNGFQNPSACLSQYVSLEKIMRRRAATDRYDLTSNTIARYQTYP